jgi:hypothetical protein
MRGDWRNFELYDKGVLTDEAGECHDYDSTPNHTVLIVGYNKTPEG